MKKSVILTSLILAVIVSILLISSCSQRTNIQQESAVSNRFLEDKNYCEQDSDCVIRDFVCGHRVQNKYYPYDKEKELKYISVAKCAQPVPLENPRCINNKCTAEEVNKVKTPVQEAKETKKTKEERLNSDAKFSCENDNTKVKKRGYVFLMGLASHYKDEWRKEREFMQQDPKATFVEIYDQDENSQIDEISRKFLIDMKVLLNKYPVDELVLFGSSAGGITASYSISRFNTELNFTGSIALHTMAAPIKGYDLTGIRANFIGDRKGYLKDIAVGFKPFETPEENVKVYHHKTVTDENLLDRCGAMKSFCDIFEIQNNNIKGSKEFFYPKYDHATIMRGVVRMVLPCYNPEIAKVIKKDSENPEEELLGGICIGEDACNKYCENNFARCKQYCKENPENKLCQKPFAFEASSDKLTDTKIADNHLDKKKASIKSTNIIENNQPILQNLGLKIEPWDKTTNKAGDFLFESKKYVNNKIFTEFGEIVEGDKGKKTLPEIGFNVPVGTTIISPIDGIVTDVKLYEPSQDYIISFKTDLNSPWIISFEHVEDVSVAKGDKVIAGQKIAKVSPSYGKTEFGNVEIAVWQGGINIVKYCPTTFLRNDLKQEYASKFTQLTADWESFREENVYRQEDWVAPGCLLNNLTEK